MIKQYKLRFYNFKLVILLTAISLFGVQLVASAIARSFETNSFWAVVMGVVLLVILSLMDYSWILNFQWIMYGLICLCLLVYDCSEVRLEVRPDGWISVASVFSYRAFQSYYYSVFCQVFLWIMKMISILSGCWQNQCSFWLFHWLLFMHNRI